MDIPEHLRVFNAAVASHDWSAFIARFTDDAVVEFVGVPAGPFIGRQAIAAAYAESPPDDTIERIGDAYAADGQLVVPYQWTTTGATGTMRFTELADRIQRLVITFDAA